jgi:uroporphyrinogen-III synthase
MPAHNTFILSTRPLEGQLVDQAKRQGIYIDMLPFIEIAPIRSVAVQQEIEQALLQSATVVFTSMNAAEAVAEHMESFRPDWRIYCIGNTTRGLVKKYFGESSIAGTAHSAAALAALLVETGGTDEVIFFCGNQRRDELPDLLQANDIPVNEIVVYHTIATAHKAGREYDGILFFSPSAVDSFFSINRLPQQTILFAIGNTTAGAIKKHTANPIIISDHPGKGNLLETAVRYFREHPAGRAK